MHNKTKFLSTVLTILVSVMLVAGTAMAATTIGSNIATGGDITVNTNKFVVTGSSGNLATAGTIAVTSASANALAVGLAGATNPAFQVDASTALQAAGLKITGAASLGTVAIAAIDSGANTNITLDAKGSGTISLNATGTGGITLGRATTITTGGLTITAGGETITAGGLNVNSTGITNAGAIAGATTGAFSGAVTVGSLNGNTITTGTGILTLGAGKTLTVSGTTTLADNVITFGGAETLTLVALKNVAFADAFSTAGAFPIILTSTASTNVTLPTTGTLATLAGIETLTNKTLTAPVLGVATGTSLATSAQNIFTAVAGTEPVIFRSATATDDDISILPKTAGAARFKGIITSADLTADKTWTFPNVTGTVVTTGDAGSIATAMVADNAVTEAKISASSGFGLGVLRTARAQYSFATDGGAVSTITPATNATIPAKAVIIGGTINSTTAATSGGAATISVGTSAGSSATSLLGATGFASFSLNALINSVATFAAPVKLTAAGSITLTVATAALTAGVIEVTVYYYVAAN